MNLFPLNAEDLIKEPKKSKDIKKVLEFFSFCNYTIEDYYKFFEMACELDPNNISYMRPIFRGAKYTIKINNTNEKEFYYKYMQIYKHEENCCKSNEYHVIVPNENYKNELEKHINNLSITKKLINLHPDICWKALYSERFKIIELVRDLKWVWVHLPHLTNILDSGVGKEAYYILTKIYDIEDKRFGKCNNIYFYFGK
jgi:hypothetical protein